jgi:hypothetical protein
MATAEETLDDPWDEVAVKERRSATTPVSVSRRDIVSINLRKKLVLVPKLDGTLQPTKDVVSLPNSCKVCYV